MLNALPEPVRNTLCGQRRASAERAKARPRKKPYQGAQQPRAHPAASNAAQQGPQRCLPGRHRQLAPFPAPQPGLHKRLAPPLPPAAQRAYRNPPSAADRFQPRAVGEHQRAHHREQRRDAETPAEEACRGRRDATPATATAQAAPSGIASELRRQTVGLARVRRAVQRRPAMRTPARAAPRRLGLIDLLEEGPDTGVGTDGVQENPMRHWRPSPRKWVRFTRHAPRGAPCKLSGGHPPSHIA